MHCVLHCVHTLLQFVQGSAAAAPSASGGRASRAPAAASETDKGPMSQTARSVMNMSIAEQ
jgi:hypothetical protein